MTFAKHVTGFLSNLKLPVQLHEGVNVMNPFLDPVTMEITRQFYDRYYSDEEKRWMIIGINPGRFGGGITGVPFTDPIRLENECGIKNPWPKKQELSSVFIYDMISAYGGVSHFYKKMYITAISPLGFTKHNKNLNYYDDKALMQRIRPFVIDCLEQQLQFGIHKDAAFCLGDGKNFKYLHALNQELKFFKTIIPLSHPRFIMQYRLKKKQEYIDTYLSRFREVCS
jgi:hypothetical protein